MVGQPAWMLVALYVGEGSEREQCCLLSSCPSFSHFPHSPQANCALQMLPWCWFPGTWACACLGPRGPLQWTILWDSQFLPPPKPNRFLQPEVFRLYFLSTGTLGCMVYLAPQLFLPVYLHANVGAPAPPTTTLPALVLQVLPCLEYSLPGLPLSTPPTGLDECFFFNSFIVRLPYSSIFWQFWLFLFLNLLLSFWLCKEAKCIYLHLRLGWNPKS